jgi:hypothetical protein
MATRQLTCKDLRAGDILLKVDDGSLLGGAIKLGQSMVGGKNARVIHAGIMFDKHFSIESQGSGVSANDIRVQNKKYGYHVFRPNNANLGQGAGTCAKMMFDIHQRSGNLGYALGGAIGSLFGGRGRATTPEQMDSLLDRIFPQIVANAPSVHLDIVGRNPPDWLLQRVSTPLPLPGARTPRTVHRLTTGQSAGDRADPG